MTEDSGNTSLSVSPVSDRILPTGDANDAVTEPLEDEANYDNDDDRSSLPDNASVAYALEAANAANADAEKHHDCFTSTSPAPTEAGQAADPDHSVPPADVAGRIKAAE